jgi:hypothetical protein
MECMTLMAREDYKGMYPLFWGIQVCQIKANVTLVLVHVTTTTISSSDNLLSTALRPSLLLVLLGDAQESDFMKKAASIRGREEPSYEGKFLVR